MKYIITAMILLLIITWCMLTNIQDEAIDTFKTELLKEQTTRNE